MCLRKFLSTLKSDCKYIFKTYRFESAVPDYDAYWAERKKTTLNAYQKFRADWIMSHIDTNNTILDFAAGTGLMQNYFLENDYKNITAIESSKSCIKALENLDINVINGSISDTELLARIPQSDIIILSEILEHLPNPEETLQTLIQKSNKAVFFSFPNTGYYAERLRLLFGKFPVQWRIHPGEHLRFWTHSDLKTWLNCLDFAQKAEIQIYEGLPFLNKLAPALFGKAFIVKISKHDNKKESPPPKQ